ncbi:molybdenum cofactor sulfurase, partial [Chrysoperla carnea]|uniref:molybdenum cofactor sulfurase n=1 Tax=Chrysoperla carnea TaxID=189513 RepID=UPI001D07A1D9
MEIEKSVEDLLIYKSVYAKDTERKINEEFPHIQEHNYLDHAGTTLYSKKQMIEIFSDFQTNFYGNPHSLNASGKLSGDTVDQIRFKILQHLNTTSEEYTIIFTQSATAALKNVGEYFHYNNGGIFAYTQDNHTSVLGMRQYAEKFHCILNKDLNDTFQSAYPKLDKNISDTNSLFVYPAQSNFNGAKYPLEWIQKVQNGCLNHLLPNGKSTNWFCLLDTASYLGTNSIDLSIFKPDFITISFYKLFGYPTGLGALIVKNSSAHALKKRYFGGGSVQISSSTTDFFVFRTNLHQSFEDGTLPYLSVISLQHCFNLFEKLPITMDMISKHVFNLAKYVYNSMVVLHHNNGQPVVKLYHDTQFEDITKQGGFINFNLLRQNGDYVGYSEVLHMANLYNIHLRTGCFCNPGACQYHLQLTTSQLKKHFEAGHICGDQFDLIEGVPTGSIRISFGYMSTRREADVLLKMIEECFITKPIIKKIRSNKTIQMNGHKVPIEKVLPQNGFKNSETNKDCYKLLNIFIYPIKSCGPFSIETNWYLSNTGLMYDRLWMIVNHSGVCLTQKQEPRMCLIKPIIDLDAKLMTLTFPDVPSISIPLEQNVIEFKPAAFCQSKVCQDQVQCIDCGDEIGNWLEIALDKPGLRLLQQYSDRISPKKAKEKTELSLANEAQFLLLNLKSIDWLYNVMENKPNDLTIDNLVSRFRPNYVINGEEAFEEMSYKTILIGDQYFEFVGACSRCQMICIDQGTSEKNAEPLRALAANSQGKIKFGVYLKHDP